MFALQVLYLQMIGLVVEQEQCEDQDSGAAQVVLAPSKEMTVYDASATEPVAEEDTKEEEVSVVADDVDTKEQKETEEVEPASKVSDSALSGLKLHGQDKGYQEAQRSHQEEGPQERRAGE